MYVLYEVSSNIHWSGVGTEENYYLSEVINLLNIRLSILGRLGSIKEKF